MFAAFQAYLDGDPGDRANGLTPQNNLPQAGYNRTSKMVLQVINPPGANIPGLSQGVIVEGGRLMFLSGHVPIRPDGTIAGPALEDQLIQVFSNISQTLSAAGASFETVARLTIYIRGYQPEQLPVIRSIRDRFVNVKHPPASALIGVAALFHPDVLVEVDAVAVIA